MDFRTRFINGAGDWALVLAGASQDLASDEGLESAIVISLFTDRLAAAGDDVPVQADGAVDRRGWWGDAYAELQGDRIGSRLWLLQRAKQVPGTLRMAEQYAAEALQWLVDDGVASEVRTTAEWVPPLHRGVLGLTVTVVRSQQPVRRYRFDLFWKGQ